MAKPKKITFMDIVNSVRRSWNGKNPKTIVQKNKKKKGKSRQQQKIDLKNEDY